MKPTSQKNKRSGHSTCALVVKGFRVGRSNGIQINVETVEHSGKVIVELWEPAEPTVNDIIRDCETIAGIKSLGVRIGMPTSKIATLPGFEALQVSDGEITFTIEDSGCIRFGDGFEHKGSADSVNAAKTLRLAGHAEEINRLLSLIAA